jgi:hypothetical protein
MAVIAPNPAVDGPRGASQSNGRSFPKGIINYYAIRCVNKLSHRQFTRVAQQ